jgi:hypothetical protein
LKTLIGFHIRVVKAKRQDEKKTKSPFVGCYCYRGETGTGGRPLPEAPTECLLKRLPLVEELRESTDASFSAMLKKREKNGFLVGVRDGVAGFA